VVAASVLAAWAAGLALFLARELNPSAAARLAEVAMRVVPMTTYYMVQDSGRHVGFASIAIDTVPQALQVIEYIVRESLDGTRVTDQMVVRMSRGLSLREFEATKTHAADTARISGRVVDSTLILSGAVADTASVSLPAFAGAIEASVNILLGDPKVGSGSALRSIDPATGKVSTRTMRVAAESLFVVVDSAVADSSGRWFAVHRDTVRAWHLVATEAPAVDVWVDAQGLIVESRLGNGLILRRTAFELAFENWRNASPGRVVAARGNGSVISGTWLASGATRPTAVLDSLRLRLGASTPGEFAARYGRSWRVGGQIAFGRTPTATLTARYSLPASERWRKVFVRDLSPGPLIESDDASVARLSARLARGDKDPAAISQRIVTWVHDSLRAVAGGPSTGAAEALALRSGDAREFALLTSAIARAAGIPARPVAGLLLHDGRFYMHAWTEVYLGRWIPVDAMLNQFPADASHLSFLTGSADIGPDLGRVLTRLELSVISSISAIGRPPSAIR
jgi:Transglutaminase-like superfamily